MQRILSFALLGTLLIQTGCALFGNRTAEEKAGKESKNGSANIATPAPIKLTGDMEDSLNASLKKRILILKFINKSPYGGKELGEFAASEVRDAISKLSEYVVVPEEEIEGYENFSTDSGKYNLKTIFEKARTHGINALVYGTIEDLKIIERGEEVGLFQTRYNTVNANIRFQLYDTSNEKLLLSKLTNAEVTEEHMRFFGNHSPDSYDSSRGESAVSKALEKVFNDFRAQAKKIAWMGRIAKIDMQHLYINAGESSGLTRGQLLKVFGPAVPITEEESKIFIGMAPGRFKGILKVVDYFGNDGAVAIIHSGAGFREKDRVEVYSPPPQ